MKIKTVEIDGKTYAEVQDGKPVYVSDDGKETAFDAPGTVATISRLNREAQTHREAKEAAETKLRAFDGIEDPAAAKDALSKIAGLDAKQLLDAGKVEEIKAAAIKAKDEEYKPILAERDRLLSELHSEKIGGSFARSKFIADKIAVPADIIESRFGKSFKLEDGKVVAYDQAGNQIYSKANPGEAAGFDEALEILVDGYAYKDSILKGTGNSGGGSRGSNGQGGGAKTISREAFEALSPADKQAKMKDGYQLTD